MVDEPDQTLSIFSSDFVGPTRFQSKNWPFQPPFHVHFCICFQSIMIQRRRLSVLSTEAPSITLLTSSAAPGTMRAASFHGILVRAVALVAFGALSVSAFHSVSTSSIPAQWAAMSAFPHAARSGAVPPINMALRKGSSQDSSPRLSPKRLAKNALRSVACAALLFGSVLVPRRATAQQPPVEAELEQTEFVTVEAARPAGPKADPALIGGAAASIVSFGGFFAVAIRKEKHNIEAVIREFSIECDKHQSYKDEFLDGKISDRSIYSSLKKMSKKDAPPDADDEFERNSRALFEETQNKNKKKKKGPEGKRPKSQNILERPGEGDDDEDLPEMETEPAAMDDDMRNMLERMLGSGAGDDADPDGKDKK